MEALTVLFGVISVLAFAFSVYQHVRHRDKENIERTKNVALRTRLEDLVQAIRLVGYTSDMIVQRAKASAGSSGGPPVTIEELQSLARACRAQAITAATQISKEHDDLTGWRFGVMIPSEPIDTSYDQ